MKAKKTSKKGKLKATLEEQGMRLPHGYEVVPRKKKKTKKK